jgi:hypothetical protein
MVYWVFQTLSPARQVLGQAGEGQETDGDTRELAGELGLGIGRTIRKHIGV